MIGRGGVGYCFLFLMGGEVGGWGVGRTQEEGVQQQGQVQGPVLSHAVVHHHLRHEDHRDVTPA